MIGTRKYKIEISIEENEVHRATFPTLRKNNWDIISNIKQIRCTCIEFDILEGPKGYNVADSVSNHPTSKLNNYQGEKSVYVIRKHEKISTNNREKFSGSQPLSHYLYLRNFNWSQKWP